MANATTDNQPEIQGDLTCPADSYDEQNTSDETKFIQMATIRSTLATTAITIGHNNDHNVGDGEGNGWRFAGQSIMGKFELGPANNAQLGHSDNQAFTTFPLAGGETSWDRAFPA
jgi:hypothetical protein